MAAHSNNYIRLNYSLSPVTARIINMHYTNTCANCTQQTHNQSTINFQQIPRTAHSIYYTNTHTVSCKKGLLVVGCGVMSWPPPQACCREGVCRNVVERQNKAGCSGSQDGIGGGGEGPRVERVPHSLSASQSDTWPHAKLLSATTQKDILLFPQKKTTYPEYQRYLASFKA